MNTELERRKQEITRSQGRRKLWQRIVSALAAVVMFVTTYVLILPVEAQNRTFCEKEAHEHSAENGCYVETKTLKCDVKHEHTDECYITLLTLICQHEEHIHNKECYADKTADIETQADWEASIKAAKLTGNWSEDILAIANTQLGYRESERNYILGENNEIKGYTRYGEWIGDKYTDWSAAFAAFCLNYTGISKDEMTYDKAPEQWAELMKSAKLFNENISETNPGDIVFIDENGDNKADRVGIVVENTEGKIKTVEGDLNNSVSYMEYVLPAAAGDSRADQADVDSSVEESKNNKDFSEEKSTLGRSGREASQTPIIIGSVSLPENPNYNPPIAITDPENPDATSEPANRVNPTSSPENRITPTTPPENRGITRASVPTLTNLDPTTKVAVLFNGNTEEFTTLADAMNFIDTAGNYEFTVVFTQANTNDAAGWNAVANKGAGAKKISFTSIYNNGTEEIKSAVTIPNDSFLYFTTETEFFNLDFVAQGTNRIFARGNKFTVGEGVTTTNHDRLLVYGGNYNTPHPSATFTGEPDITVLSGSWAYVCAGGYGTSDSSITSNASIYIGGEAYVDRVVAGGNSSAFTGDSTITLAGQATVSLVTSGGWTNYVNGNVTVNVTEQAQVTTRIYGGFHDNTTANSVTYNLDGSNGAYVRGIVGTAERAKSRPATLYTVNVKNMEMHHIDMYSNNSSSGRVLIEGNCVIQYHLATNASTDIVLAENATLQVGSNSTLTQPGADDFAGMIWLNNSLVFNANSKFITAGDSKGVDNRYMKNIDVRGAGAEMDIFKSSAGSMYIRVNGQYLGSEKLALGLFMDPHSSPTPETPNDILLQFSNENNAKKTDYVGGDNVNYVYKHVQNITASFADADLRFMDGSRPIKPLESGILTNILTLPTGVYNYPDSLYQFDLEYPLHYNKQNFNDVPHGAVVAHYKLYNAAKIGDTYYDIECIARLTTGLASNNIQAMHDITNNNFDWYITDEVAGSYIRSYFAMDNMPTYYFFQTTTFTFYKHGEDVPALMPALAYGNTSWGNRRETYTFEDHGTDLYAIDPNMFIYVPSAGGYRPNWESHGESIESTMLVTFTKENTTSFTMINVQNAGGIEIPFLRFSKPISSSVSVEKHFSGAPTQTSGESCTFLVQQCDSQGNPITGMYDLNDESITQTCVDGTVISGFGNCTYYNPGTYYNLITETTCSGTYVVDSTRYLQTVTVTFDDTNFVLNVSESYKNLETGETVDRPSFNNRYSLHKLTLDETIIGGSASTAFPFTVEITDSTGNNIYQVPSADIKVYDATGNDVTPATIARDTEGNPVISMGDGWSIVIENIPHNYIVTITETGFSGYSCDVSGDGTETAADSGITQPIVMNGDKTVHYLNERSTVELTITKTVVGGGTGPFGFTVTFTDTTGDPVNIPAPAANSGYTVTNNVATFDLNKDGSVTITGIPVDTVATIVETSHNGYTVQYNFSDGTPSVSGDTATVTISDDLTVTCINNAGFELPHTGGTGSLILTLGGVILIATALMYGISLKRRQWRAWI